MNPIDIIEIKDVPQKLAEIFGKNPIKGYLQGNRKIWKGLPNKNVVLFPSVKNQSLMPCESKLEADNCLAIEFDKSVKNYRTQPLTIRLNGKESYTPDTVQTCVDGYYTFTEVKFSGSLKSSKLRERLAKIKLIFASAGYRYEVMTEHDLQKVPGIQNRKYLYRSARFKFHKLQVNEALSVITGQDKSYSLRSYRNDCKSLGLNPLIADWTIFFGHVQFDEQMPLCGHSFVWKKGGVQ